MDIETTILLSILVGIAGTVAGFYIRLLINRTRVEALDAITKYAWTAVRAARDTIKSDSRGADKFNYATGVVRKAVGDRGDLIDNAVKAAYQNMKGI